MVNIYNLMNLNLKRFKIRSANMVNRDIVEIKSVIL